MAYKSFMDELNERVREQRRIEAEVYCEELAFWRNVRVNAAIAAMQGYIGGNSALGMDENEISEWSVKQADALIEELKKEK